ncbi:MAG TPA: acyl-ACP--UDP-N-acetylglucosamine O-acyltransferase [Chthoniobacterales bacterium]
MIHATAFVHPDAQVDPSATIEPYAIVDGPAIIGPRTTVQSHAVITGRVTLGVGNVIGYGSVIGGYPQDLSFDAGCLTSVAIGDHNVIREHCTIHRGTKADSETVVGSHNFLMAGAHLGHNARIGNGVILANNVLLGGYATVGDRAFLGGGSVVHQHTRIGALAILQGLTAVSKDVPPFVVAAGRNSVVAINVVGLKRAGFDSAQRREAKQAFALFYGSGRNATQARTAAAETSWSKAVQPFWDFVADSRRGLCSLTPWHEIKAGSAPAD